MAGAVFSATILPCRAWIGLPRQAACRRRGG